MKTTIEVNKKTAQRIQILKHTLGYSTADKTLNAIIDIIEKMENKK